MKKFMFLASAFVFMLTPAMPQVSAMLGVSSYAAKRIVDAIMAGASVWTLVSLLIVSGGSLAVAWALVKQFIKRFGAKAAIAW